MNVTVLTTGGTVASRPAGQPMAHGAEVLSGVPGLDALANVTLEEYCVVASSQITPDMMFGLARRVKELLSGDVDGVVVTHGTDTMEETIYMLDMLVPGTKPVVITGAMRISADLGTEGARNIYAAVAVAAAPESCGRGAMLVLNDEIHMARWVTKGHSYNPATFKSPACGRAGEVHGSKVVFYTPPAPREAICPAGLGTPVDLIKTYAGSDDRLIQAAIQTGAQGIVLEVMGKGNVPRCMFPGLVACNKANVPVVMVTRCHAGHIEIQRYEDELGCINGGELSGPKARLRLMAVLGITGPEADVDKIRPYFAK